MRTIFHIFIFTFIGLVSVSQTKTPAKKDKEPEKVRQIEIRHAGVLRYDKGIKAQRLSRY